MAFPASPVDGQIYNGYIYNLTKGAWDVYKNLSLANAVGSPANGGLVSGTKIYRFEQGTWDVSYIGASTVWSYKWSYYMIINDMCHVNFGGSATTYPTSGDIIYSLPYPVNDKSDTTQWEGALTFFDLTDSFPSRTQASVSDVQGGIILKYYGDSSDVITFADLTAAPNFRISGWYKI